MEQVKYVRFYRNGACWHEYRETYSSWRSPRRTQSRVVSACKREYDAGKCEIVDELPAGLDDTYCRTCLPQQHGKWVEQQAAEMKATREGMVGNG